MKEVGLNLEVENLWIFLDKFCMYIYIYICVYILTVYI